MKSRPTPSPEPTRRRGAVVTHWGAVVFLGLVPTTRAALAQDPAPAATTAPAQANAPDLTIRYRFQERYAVERSAVGPGPAVPGALGTYRVAFKDAISKATDRPQGAPEITQSTLQMIYTERVAAANTRDERLVTDVVRRYDAVRVSPTPASANKAKPYVPVQGMTFWIKRRPNDLPEVFNLTPGRVFRDEDYLLVAGDPRAGDRRLFFPNLAYLLPELPSRIGDTWQVTRSTVASMLGMDVANGSLEGKLIEVKPDAKGGDSVATFSVSGRILTQYGDAGVNARVEFSFAPPPAPVAGGGETAGAHIVDARGGITRVKLAQTSTASRDDDPSGRLLVKVRRDLTVERQLHPDALTLDVPPKMPTPDEQNSWLTYIDPLGRIEFRHPQDLPLIPQNQDPNVVIFFRMQPDGKELQAVLKFGTKSQVGADFGRKDFIAQMDAEGRDVTPGASEQLPDADWPKMRVHRSEFVLQSRDPQRRNSSRSYTYAYHILTGRDLSLYVEATTSVDPPTPFRKSIEAMIKTMNFEPASK